MSILRRIFPLLLTAALLCACVQMPNTPQDVLPATTPQPTAAPAATLEEFAQNLRTGRNLDEKREALLHTMACKAAIKGGWTSDPAELKILVEKVQSGEVRYCPHGRPVVVKVTKYELEKLFKRA